MPLFFRRKYVAIISGDESAGAQRPPKSGKKVQERLWRGLFVLREETSFSAAVNIILDIGSMANGFFDLKRTMDWIFVRHRVTGIQAIA